MTLLSKIIWNTQLDAHETSVFRPTCFAFRRQTHTQLRQKQSVTISHAFIWISSVDWTTLMTCTPTTNTFLSSQRRMHMANSNFNTAEGFLFSIGNADTWWLWKVAATCECPRETPICGWLGDTSVAGSSWGAAVCRREPCALMCRSSWRPLQNRKWKTSGTPATKHTGYI